MSVYDVDLQTQDKLLFPEFPEFVKFPKMSRFFRDIIITEKIDGTNSQIFIPDEPDQDILAGSRNRYISQGDSGIHGLVGWVEQNRNTLRRDLGPGRHFGEWWGCGIQRGYGLDEKRFSLFNTTRWDGQIFATPQLCVVPVLHQGPMSMIEMWHQMEALEKFGSVAAPGFMNPEGIVIFHTDANMCFKYTGDGDGHKSGTENS